MSSILNDRRNAKASSLFLSFSSDGGHQIANVVPRHSSFNRFALSSTFLNQWKGKCNFASLFEVRSPFRTQRCTELQAALKIFRRFVPSDRLARGIVSSRFNLSRFRYFSSLGQKTRTHSRSLRKKWPRGVGSFEQIGSFAVRR